MVNSVRGNHTHCGLCCPFGVPEKPGRGDVIDKPGDSVEDRPEKLPGIPQRVQRLIHHGCEGLSLFLTADHQDGLFGSPHNSRPQCHAVIGRDWHTDNMDQGIIVTDRKFNFTIIN